MASTNGNGRIVTFSIVGVVITGVLLAVAATLWATSCHSALADDNARLEGSLRALEAQGDARWQSVQASLEANRRYLERIEDKLDRVE